MLRRSILALLFFFVSTLVNAAWIESKEHDGIVYFLDDSPATIKRYSLVSQSFLPEIDLTVGSAILAGVPIDFHVDNAGIYIAFGRSVYRYDLGGGNEFYLGNANYDITGIVSHSNNLVIVSERDIKSVNKLTGNSVDIISSHYRLQGISVSEHQNKIVARTQGISPSDIRTVEITSNGIFGNQADSPYHGEYPDANKVYVFPDGERVIDDAGIIYNINDLTYDNSLAGALYQITFSGNEPVVLRGSTLYAYSTTLGEKGVYTLSVTPNKVAVYNNTIFSFYESENAEIAVANTDIGLLVPPEPVLPVNPDNLAYSIDDIKYGNDIVFILSREHLNIFRWSISLESYIDSIPLTQAPTYMTYSEVTNRLYLAYPTGKITQVVFDNSLDEVPYVNLPYTPYALEAAEQFIFATDPSGLVDTYYTFDQYGVMTSSVDLKYWSNQYEWSSVNNRLYYINGSRITWEEINTTTGEFGLYHNSIFHHNHGDLMNPIRSADDGSVILLGSGRVYDAISLEYIDALPVNINDAAWVNNQLITIRQDGSDSSVIELWTDSYTLSRAVSIIGTPIRLFSLENKILIVTSVAGVLNFIADSDIDGVGDTMDVFPLDPTETADADNDGVGNNADLDDDNDGVNDLLDAFPFDAAETLDSDGDGVGDNADAFPFDESETQDSDGDGIGDNSDELPYDPTRSKIFLSDYFPLEQGYSWLYDDSSIPAVTQEAININGQSVFPILYDDGSKLYFKVTQDGIYLYGYFIPDFFNGHDTNFLFNAPFTLLLNDLVDNQVISQEGNGDFEIQLNNETTSMSYNGTLTYLGEEEITVPYGNVKAKHVAVDLTDYFTINGAAYYSGLNMELWFAPDVGIVRVRGNGYETNLVSVSLISAQSNSTSNNSAGGGGGCSINKQAEFDPVLMLMLLIIIGYILKTNRGSIL